MKALYFLGGLALSTFIWFVIGYGLFLSGVAEIDRGYPAHPVAEVRR